MAIQQLLLKTLNIFKAYLLIISVLALTLLQLNIVSFIFSLDDFFKIQPLLFSSMVIHFGSIEMIVLSSLVFCCVIWLCYRPVIILYLYIKTKIHYLTVLSTYFNKAEFKAVDNVESQYSWIVRSAKKISKKLSITPPKIIISASLDINAKVAPGFFHAPVIILTQGLIKKLTADEVEAVLAHELAHIAKNDTYIMSITDLILFVSIWLPVNISHFIIDYVLLYKWRSKNIGYILSLFFVLLMYGFFALLFLNSLNRYYEFRADKIAMGLVNLQSFLSALQRIHDSQSDAPWVLEWCMASTPKAVQHFVLKIFLSHPSLSMRIQALQ